MGIKATIAPKDPLTVSVRNAVDVTPEYDEKDKIISIDIPDVATIKLGDKLNIDKGKMSYRVNSILKKEGFGNVAYELKMAKRTKASLFILPMLPGHKHKYLYDKFLLNCFIATPEETNVIALLYRWSGIKSFMEMEKAFQKLGVYKGHVDTTKSTVLYIFNVPKKYFRDYEKFVEGKYSEMSESYKRRILQFHSVDKKNIIGQILYKDPERRERLAKALYEDGDSPAIPEDAELYSIPELFDEQFQPEVYRI